MTQRLFNRTQAFRSSLGTLRRVVPLLWRSEPVGVSLLALAIAAQAALPALTLLLTRWTVDELTGLGQPGHVFPLGRLIGFWLALQLVQPLLDVANSLLQGNIADKFTLVINLTLMTKAEELKGLDALEGKAFHDTLKVIQDGASNRPMNLVVLLALSVRDTLSVVSLMVILASLAWWVPLALLAATLPATLATLRVRDVGFQTLMGNSEDGRLMAYLSRVALGLEHAHEVRLFNLVPWLKERYTTVFSRAYARMRSVRRKEVTHILPTYLLSVSVSAGLFAWAINRASAGRITAGQVVIVLQALSQTLFTLRDIVNYIGMLRDRILYFQTYLDFLALTPAVQQPREPQPVGKRAAYALEFDNVSFSYPGGQTALNNVSFRIEAGETVALVGENGAGKSTIIKLLLRFYDPDGGRVLVEGRDLKTLDLTEWRGAVSAVFQDFSRYDFSLRENIGVGDLTRLDDKVSVATAAEHAGLAETVKDLPEGLDTGLGKAFGGAQLSGGQWQKVALARALLRGAGVLILDEPTASIDPRGEYALFKQFAELAKTPTTILVTHRLASVRLADRIFVMRHGELVQQGSHQQLLATPGEYADLWAMQAEAYAEMA